MKEHVRTFPPSQAFSTPLANCTDGDLRLVGGDDDSEGRVEICINSAWGTICNNMFDDVDAGVVCQQLGGFERHSELLVMCITNSKSLMPISTPPSMQPHCLGRKC